MKSFRQFIDELNAGPSSPITPGQPGVPKLGAGRIGKIRIKNNQNMGNLQGMPIPKV